jgi:hypothetical protein
MVLCLEMPREVVRPQNGGAFKVVRNALIVIEVVAGIGAMAIGARMLAAREPRPLRTRALGRFAIALLIVIGAALICAAALLLAGVSQARLVSVEAGVLFAGWIAGHLALAGFRHWMQLVALALGVATVLLALMLPCPG